MVLYSRARKEVKKEPFLKAFARTGNISAAAKAVRISRDAVHDWRRNDPAFSSAFLVAKRASKDQLKVTINDAIDFFTDAIRPFVPVALWPRIHSRIQIAASEKRFKAHGTAGSVPSRITQVDVSLPTQAIDRRANSTVGNDTLHRSF